MSQVKLRESKPYKPASFKATSGASDLASKKGIDLASLVKKGLKGSGSDGKITKSDLESFLSAD